MLLEDAELLVEENKDQIMVLAMAVLQLGPVLDGEDIEALLFGLDSDERNKLCI